MSSLNEYLERELSKFECSVHRKQASVKVENDQIAVTEICCEEYKDFITEKAKDLSVQFTLDQLKF